MLVKVPALVENEPELNPAEPAFTFKVSALPKSVPTVSVPLLTFTVPVNAVRLPPKLKVPVEVNDPAPVNVPVNAPPDAVKVPALLMVPPLSVVIAAATPDPSTTLPSDAVPIVLPVPASVKDPPPRVVKYAVPELMLTVPALNVVNNRFAPLVKLVNPAPSNAAIATDPPLAVKARLPALFTVPSDPAEVALVPNVAENVADPPEEMFNPLPPLISAPTDRVPLPTFNVPL